MTVDQSRAGRRRAGQAVAGRGAELLARLHGGLIVSCQAAPGEPLHGPVFMTAMARSAVGGGAVAVRVNGLPDVRAVGAAVDVPLVGLWKDGDTGVYITPTVAHALAVADAGAHIVAVDGTDRPRPDGAALADAVAAVHTHTQALVMADVATVAQGRAAAAAGADLIGTTLSGYTDDGPPPPGPDLDLVGALSAAVDVPVLAEGRIGTPAEAARALSQGAWAVVVGGAITQPGAIAARFVAALATMRVPRRERSTQA